MIRLDKLSYLSQQGAWEARQTPMPEARRYGEEKHCLLGLRCVDSLCIYKILYVHAAAILSADAMDVSGELHLDVVSGVCPQGLGQ